MLALGLDAAKHLAIAFIVGFVVLALIAATAIKTITTKIIITSLLLGLALGVWTQRTNLVGCAREVKAKAETLDTSKTACTFFGSEITLPQVGRD